MNVHRRIAHLPPIALVVAVLGLGTVACNDASPSTVAPDRAPTGPSSTSPSSTTETELSDVPDAPSETGEPDEPGS